jgi:hypothetical protein
VLLKIKKGGVEFSITHFFKKAKILIPEIEIYFYRPLIFCSLTGNKAWLCFYKDFQNTNTSPNEDRK